MSDQDHPGLPARLEALEMAHDFCQAKGIFDVPTKPNGYPVDGWKPMTPADKLFEIKQLADWILENNA